MKSSENNNYKRKDPMSPEKIRSHEPTAVKRDPNDQEIVKTGRTGTNTEEALEQYKKQGMTKIVDNSDFIDKNNESNTPDNINNLDSVSYGEVKEDVKDIDTFDKMKAGVKALGKKITDPDSDLEDEYEQEILNKKESIE